MKSHLGRGRNGGGGASIRSQKQAVSWGFAVSQGSDVECFEFLGVTGMCSVKSTSPTTENLLRKLCTYSMNNNMSDEDKHDTNYINNKYTNTYTRKLHNLWART